MNLQSPQDGLARLKADEPIHLFAFFQDQQRRYALDTESSGGCLVRIYIKLSDEYTSRKFAC